MEVIMKPFGFIRNKSARVTVVICCAYCGKEKIVRQADVNRGWGKYCCKSHAAKDRELHKSLS